MGLASFDKDSQEDPWETFKGVGKEGGWSGPKQEV